jgi:hypothetical protein
MALVCEGFAVTLLVALVFIFDRPFKRRTLSPQPIVTAIAEMQNRASTGRLSADADHGTRFNPKASSPRRLITAGHFKPPMLRLNYASDAYFFSFEKSQQVTFEPPILEPDSYKFVQNYQPSRSREHGVINCPNLSRTRNFIRSAIESDAVALDRSCCFILRYCHRILFFSASFRFPVNRVVAWTDSLNEPI